MPERGHQKLGVGPGPMPSRRTLHPTEGALTCSPAEAGREPVPVAKRKHRLDAPSLERKRPISAPFHLSV